MTACRPSHDADPVGIDLVFVCVGPEEQICVTLANYAGLTYSGSSQAFSDDSSIASWAKNAVYACRERGLISGMGNNTFAPKDNAQRAQACVIILNAYNQGL